MFTIQEYKMFLKENLENSFIYENDQLLKIFYNFNKRYDTIEQLKIALDKSNRGWANN